MPSGMIECEESGTVLLEENISDGDGTYFGRARVYTSAGGLSSTTNINHVAGGLYQGTVAAPVVGKYSVLFDWWENAGRTTPAGTAKTGVENTSTQLRVKALPAEPGDEMDLITDAVDANSVATTGANEIRDTIISDATTFQGADIAAILADTAAIDTLTSTNLDVVVSTRATQAQILSDATPFPGANIDAAITSRSSHSAADVDTTLTGTHGAGSWTSASALTAQNVRDAMKLAPTVGAPAAGSVDEHLDDILVDTTAIETDTQDIQTRLPAALVSGRMDASVGAMAAGTITAAAIATDAIDADAIAADAIGASELATSAVDEIADGVWDELIAGHLTAGTTGKALQDAGATTSPTVIAGAVWDAARSSYVNVGSFGEALDAKVSDVETDTADIQTRLPAALVGGRIDADVGNIQAGAIDATAIAANAITAGKIATDAITSDELATSAINEIRDGILSDSTPFAGADVAAILADTSVTEPLVSLNLDAKVSTRSSHTAANVDTVLTGTHGAGAWTSAAALTAQNVRDAMKLAPTAGAPAAGSVDEHLDDVLADTAAIDGRLPSDPADESLLQASHTTTQADIAALNDLSQADVQTALTSQGYTSARAPNLDNISTTALVAADVENAVLDATLSSHLTAGSLGEALVATSGHAGLHSVLDGGAGQAAVIHNGNNNLTSARLRIFASKAAADAATLGGADGADSEMLRLNFDAATYSAGNTSAVPEVLDAARRTSA